MSEYPKMQSSTRVIVGKHVHLYTSGMATSRQEVYLIRRTLSPMGNPVCISVIENTHDAMVGTGYHGCSSVETLRQP